MAVNFDLIQNAIGNLAQTLSVADFNGDGNSDIAVVNESSDNVLVLLGDDNNFAAPQSFAVGNSPRSVTVADFNGDEKLDLITANYLSSDVSVLLGDGNGNFDAAQNFAVGNNPDSLIVGDFNGDGNSDIAAINLSSGNVSVLLNNPSPNNPPIANDDEFTTLENEAFRGGKVFVNNGRGVDSDPDSDILTVIEVNSNTDVGNQIILDSGALLTMNSDGTFDYDPNGQFDSLNDGETTTDSFEYTISDGKGGTDSGIVTFTIVGTQEQPVSQIEGIVSNEIFSDRGEDAIDNSSNLSDLTIADFMDDFTVQVRSIITDNSNDMDFLRFNDGLLTIDVSLFVSEVFS
ncbi:VCBS repeat-containing protein [Rivularia sp. PCC 7116]|uniref:FG-GAP-like repeat-containing protein n=1 Tax=Rivularia sp. PCC 7116 TaxID=373994 RepID=UPI00029ED3DF|nr:FG-GAP-like repeat-containing protein [Rivularia sp. PCC 7116]AFY55293.1 VCBS repeat-containing protein [Rivularia sp. PCC 7116]